MIITDQVLFKIPKDRELQWPAMATVQSWVNGFSDKMKANNPIRTEPVEFRLMYELDMTEEDFGVFKRAGLKLTQEPERIGWPDMVVDLTEESIGRFKDPQKHTSQFHAIMCGAPRISRTCPPIPEIRQVKVKHQDFLWGELYGPSQEKVFMHQLLSETMMVMDLFGIKDHELTGVIGYASWQTYMAASMGLPVIEIIPPGRPRNILSKWVNLGYRMVEESEGNIPEQVEAGIKSVESMISANLKGAPLL